MLSEYLLGSAAIIIGYLLGSIPTAYIVTKLKLGKDIRDIDVGNVGTAATFRQVGFAGGAIVGAVDVAKGIASILIARAMGVSEPWVLGAGFAAILGHSFPIYIGFRGGQGAATTLGIFIILAPKSVAVLLLMMAITFCFTRRFFPMLCITFPFLPLLNWIFYDSVKLILFSAAIVIYTALRNRRGLTLLLTAPGNPFKKKTG